MFVNTPFANACAVSGEFARLTEQAHFEQLLFELLWSDPGIRGAAIYTAIPDSLGMKVSYVCLLLAKMTFVQQLSF